jgi:hypothetical protein
MQRAILAGVAAMMAFKDDQNEPCNEFLTKSFLVMVPPSLMAQGLGRHRVAGQRLGLDQPDRRAEGLQDPLRRQPAALELDRQVRVFGLDGTQKPFINQVEVDTTLSAKAEGSDFEHDNDAHEYGVKRVGNAAYGDWKKACLVTLQA